MLKYTEMVKFLKTAYKIKGFPKILMDNAIYYVRWTDCKYLTDKFNKYKNVPVFRFRVHLEYQAGEAVPVVSDFYVVKLKKWYCDKSYGNNLLHWQNQFVSGWKRSPFRANTIAKISQGSMGYDVEWVGKNAPALIDIRSMVDEHKALYTEMAEWLNSPAIKEANRQAKAARAEYSKTLKGIKDLRAKAAAKVIEQHNIKKDAV